tara:strand:- start:250 stop:444 length:195 start_codon:yes stop_codon:yes gene_type:complete
LHPAIGHSAFDAGDLAEAILVSGHNIVAGSNVKTASLFGLLLVVKIFTFFRKSERRIACRAAFD